jgi:pyrroloquinoline quinone (PQQ) biosynthesis protein C
LRKIASFATENVYPTASVLRHMSERMTTDPSTTQQGAHLTTMGFHILQRKERTCLKASMDFLWAMIAFMRARGAVVPAVI